MIYYENYYFKENSKDKEDFFVKQLEYEYYAFPENKSNMLLYTIFFEQHRVERDYSSFLLFSDSFTDHYTKIQKTTYVGTLPSDRVSSLYLMLYKRNLTNIFKFKFTSLSDCISVFGGTFEIVCIIVKYFHVLTLSFHYKAYLINSVFSFYVDDQEAINNRRKISLAYNLKKEPESNNIQMGSESSRGIKKVISAPSSSTIMNQTELKESLSKMLSMRKKWKVNSLDTLIASFNKLRNKESQKDKLISLLHNIIEDQIDYSKIITNSLDIYSLKESLVDSSLIKLISFPNLNMNKFEETIKYIQEFRLKFNLNDIDNKTVSDLVLKDFNDLKYKTILKKLTLDT